MSRRYRVGVVGFGVAGATAAYLLAKGGHEVSLFERAPVLGPVGAGILLQPSGQMVLDRLGLLEPLKALAEPIDELHALKHNGRTLIRMPYALVEPNCVAYGVHRGDLFTLLQGAVESQPVRIRLNCEIIAGCEFGDAVSLTDRDGGEHGPFDFVIAADGSRSALRAAAGVVRWLHSYEHAALWAIGGTTAVSRKLHQVVHGTKLLLGLLPTGGGRCSLFWGLRSSDKDALWARGFGAWRDSVLRICPLAEGVFDSVTSFEEVRFTTYQHVWLTRPYRGRTIFIGDAAHAMSPHLGQGINLALIDAFTLAHVLATTTDLHRAFRAFAAARSAHIRFYSVVTLALTPFFQSNGFIKGWGRDIALPILSWLPLLRGQMALTMAGLKGGFLRGRISIDDR
jgi:2-polyprenyl-6-methoxyphenol hydroxylase-like FAD-dependent oxidoreductase